MPGYEVQTVPQAGWAGIKNGRLLTLAAANFDVFITVDRNLNFQQNTKRLAIAIIVLCAQSNRFEDLLPLVPETLTLLDTIRPGEVKTLGKGQ